MDIAIAETSYIAFKAGLSLSGGEEGKIYKKAAAHPGRWRRQCRNFIRDPGRANISVTDRDLLAADPSGTWAGHARHESADQQETNENGKIAEKSTLG